jgi:hypothetical protein
MDIFWHVVYSLGRHRFLVMPVGIMVPILLLVVANKWISSAGWLSCAFMRTILVLIPIYSILNIIFGMMVATNAVHAHGVTGHATVTGSYDTGNLYNEQKVMGYHMLVNTADNRVMETSFEEDDFNVYPPHNSVRYPGVGDHFNVQYLKAFPQDFIIVSDDDSPWAVHLRCSDLGDRMAQAAAKYDFAPETPAYRTDYIDASQAYLSGNCCSTDGERQLIQEKIANAKAGHR